MPCYDPPRPEDKERDRLIAGAHSALLCGLMKENALEKQVAEAWCLVHAIVDAEIAKGTRYSERSTRAQKLCDTILIDYNLKRGAVELCKHPKAWESVLERSGGRYCPDCGVIT